MHGMVFVTQSPRLRRMGTGHGETPAVPVLGAEWRSHMASVASIIGAIVLVVSCAPTPTPTPAPTPVPTPTLAPTPTPVAAGCAGTLQAGIDAAAAGSVLDLTGCTYAAGATVTKPLTIVGATIRPAAGTAGLVVKASDVTLDGLHLIGPQATTYRDGEFGITVMATASAPARRLTIRNSEIASFGKAGMWLRYVSDLVVEHNDVHDIVYAGIMVISGTGGRISENTVARIGVHGAEANDNNAYGISLEDQGLPVTTDFTVSGNTVTGVPTWHGLDTHGGQRIAFTGNAVSGAPRALFITTGSGRPTDITVSGNLFGSPAPATDNLLAVTTYDSVNVTVTGNTAAGWPAGQFFEDYRGLSTGLVVSGNTETP